MRVAQQLDRVGIAVAWGKSDLVLPSLWQGIAGADADWAIRDETGAIIPSITGRAYIVSEGRLMREIADPFADGIRG